MKKETCGIYVITERATQRAIYVGQSIGIEGRWSAYKNRFPQERFDYRIIQECLPAELNFWEKYYISALKTHWTEAGENQNWGGQYWPRPEEPMSPATRAKISATLKGRVQSEEEKAKRSATLKGRNLSKEHKAKLKGRVAPNKGKPMSEEQRAKSSATQKGRVLSEEHKAKLKGKTRSEESRAKLSAALKGRVQSEEEKAKRSASNKGLVSPNKGKPMSEEQKMKISEAVKARLALKRAAEAAAAAALEALLFTETETETISSPE